MTNLAGGLATDLDSMVRAASALGVGGWGLGGQCINEHRSEVKEISAPNSVESSDIGVLLGLRAPHGFCPPGCVPLASCRDRPLHAGPLTASSPSRVASR